MSVIRMVVGGLLLLLLRLLLLLLRLLLSVSVSAAQFSLKARQLPTIFREA